MPPPADPTLATQLLRQSENDDDSQAAELLALVGDELRRIAAAYLSRERAGHTLQPTALVNEAYLKLIDSTVIASGDRERFLGYAARAMRQVLIDFARQRRTQRRGGEGWQRVSLHADLIGEGGVHDAVVDLLDLDAALSRLAEVHEKAARVVELSYFGGLTHDEVAAVMGLSVRMVGKYWHTARAWLGRELRATDPT